MSSFGKRLLRFTFENLILALAVSLIMFVILRVFPHLVLGFPLSLFTEVWLAKFAPESTTIPDNTSPPPDETSPPFSIILIVIALITVAVISVGLLVYLKKRKR